MKSYVKGQLVFINRVIWADGQDEPVERRVNEPVIFLRDEVTFPAGQPYHRIWFKDADGKEDFIHGMESMIELPRTVEELFGHIPTL